MLFVDSKKGIFMDELFISAMPYYEQNAVIKVICAG